MSFNLTDIDLNAVETEDRPTVLGPGKYEVNIFSAKYEKNKSGTGWNLVLEMRDQKSSGYITSWMTLTNSEYPNSQRIGLEKLKAMLTNMGWDNAHPPEADWYKGKPLGINVVDEVDKEGKKNSRVNYTYPLASTPAPDTRDDDPLPF